MLSSLFRKGRRKALSEKLQPGILKPNVCRAVADRSKGIRKVAVKAPRGKKPLHDLGEYQRA